ncbi:MAG: C40 family peptidase [Akkermansiaceae bacterium]|nr:C40 family peptidase [Akkermansiaceae bacterium]
MLRFLTLWLGFCLASPAAETPTTLPAAQIEAKSLHLPDDLPTARRKLVIDAVETAGRLKLGAYVFGSDDPDRGGFDCSGSISFLLRRAGLEVPRSSAGQYEWVRNAGKLTAVPAEVRSLDHPVFASLQPGDLLFWGGTYEPRDGRKNPVTHVQMYLGKEADGLPVMIGSSDGRSYRGKKRCGFGVFDFKLPGPASKARFLGFGTPPGLVTAP